MSDVNVSDFAVASIKGDTTVNYFSLGELGFEPPKDSGVSYEDIENFVTRKEFLPIFTKHCLGGDFYLARRVTENGDGTYPFSEDSSVVFEPMLQLTQFIGRISARGAVS